MLWIFCIVVCISLNTNAQKDTIVTKTNDLIVCKIQYIDEQYIQFKYEMYPKLYYYFSIPIVDVERYVIQPDEKKSTHVKKHNKTNRFFNRLFNKTRS